MAGQSDIKNMAVFCDIENVARGVDEANLEKFDVELVLDKLLVKGNVVVKRAYCDWARFPKLKPTMHEAAFELIDIPHLRQSGKNSADIRMVVDALDLCFTKTHVDTFVLMTGDSDFSPLVSKLRENNRVVIGVGVRKSTSDLLSSNCHEFIYYDDLVRAKSERRGSLQVPGGSRAGAAGLSADVAAVAESDPRRAALELVRDTLEDLLKETDAGRTMPGPLKNAVIRKRPGFDEGSIGYASFSRLLEEAQKTGMLKLSRDERSGQYLIASIDRGV